MQIIHVLLDDASYVLQLRELVPVVLGEHALGADDLVAELAEVLDLLLGVTTAEHLRGV